MLTTEFKMEDAIAVWKEEGFEEGLEKGLERGRTDTALKLLLKGYPESEIIELTGLTQAALEKLKIKQ